jgi:hypothetical protein
VSEREGSQREPGARRAEELPYRRWRPDVVLLAVLATTAFGILLGYLSKTPCTGPPYDAYGISANLGAKKYSALCYSDVQQLWVGRGVREHLFPYLTGRLEPSDRPEGNLVGGAVEYPVVTGVFMWLAGLGASTDGDYLRTTALLLAPFGLLTGGLLARLAGWRALIWAAAPALVLYSVHNWDFLATACVVGAVWAWARGRPGSAAMLLGLGAATKIYPGFLALPLLLERLALRDVRGAVRVVAGTGGVWAAINVPVLLANPDGWWATYAYQAGRAADLTTNSIWYWGFPDLGGDQVNRWSAALIAASWALAVLVGWATARRTGRYPWLQVGAALLASFLLFNKVYSPQYVLWLLPFFVLLRLRWGWWVSYLAVDLLLYVGLFRWYYDITQGGDFGVAKQAAVLGVWGKAVLLALLYVVFLRSSPVVPDPSDGHNPPASPEPSDPFGAAQRSRDPASTSGPRSSAASSTPPAGSSAVPPVPSARTRSRSGLSTSRTTSAASTTSARSRSNTARRNHS